MVNTDNIEREENHVHEIPDFVSSLTNARCNRRYNQNFLLGFYGQIYPHDIRITLIRRIIRRINNCGINMIIAFFATNFEDDFRNYYHNFFNDSQLINDFDLKINKMLRNN